MLTCPGGKGQELECAIKIGELVEERRLKEREKILKRAFPSLDIG